MFNSKLNALEMAEKYPNQWLFIVDFEVIGGNERFSGVIIANDKCSSKVCKIAEKTNLTGNTALHYTGELPKENNHFYD